MKSAIVQVDAAPFKQWYLQHYGVDVGRKKKVTTKKETTEVIYDCEILLQKKKKSYVCLNVVYEFSILSCGIH